jgi:uncharacterized damage-inducible protein DinB
MYGTIEEFLSHWEEQTQATRKIFGVLTDASLGQAVTEGHRTLGRIAWHIVTTMPEMMGKTGLEVSIVEEEAPVPATAAEIAETYEKVTAELAGAVRTSWKDEDLAVEDEMYGFRWARRTTCRLLIEHQSHHVGQMTVLLRQAGLKVPGICGPSLEEWEAMGMPVPEV